MPIPTVPLKPLLSYKLLAFDIYGTLIDWETGIISRLQPLISRLPSSHAYQDRITLAARVNEIEATIQSADPGLLYSKVLEGVYLKLAEELDFDTTDSAIKSEALDLGSSVGSWPAFPDTLDAMHRLKKYFPYLIPLSNVDRKSFQATYNGPLKGAGFTTYFLAEDIGSYKPDLKNFEYLLGKADKEYGVEKEEVLQVAQSLFHDHVPAKQMGMASVWICRKGAGMGGDSAEVHRQGKVGYGWRFNTLGEFADAVEKEAEKQT